MQESLKEIIKFQISRSLLNLAKEYIISIEDLRNSGYNITDDEFKRLRKRALDGANHGIRELTTLIDKSGI